MSLYHVKRNEEIGVYSPDDFITFLDYIEENDFLIMIDGGSLKSGACVAFTKFGLVQFSHYFIRIGALCNSLE